MKWILLFWLLLTANNVFAKRNIIHSIYLVDNPDFDGNDEYTMVGEFGFLLADSNINTTTITAKMNTSQELTSWSDKIIGDVLYKHSQQSQQKVDNGKNSGASAQKLFLSGQFNYKLTKPDERIFIYGEYENNRFSGFRYQTAIAAGWSSRLWHNKHSELKYIVLDRVTVFLKLNKAAALKTTKLTGILILKLSFSINIDPRGGPDIEELNTETAITLVCQFFKN